MIYGLKNILFERASLERDRILFNDMMEDARLHDALESAYDKLGMVTEAVSNEEIEKLIEVLPETDDDDAQVERILKMNVDDADGVLGLDDGVVGPAPDEI